MIPQEKDTYCVCAVLQEIFKDFNINFRQDEIANRLTPSEKGFYVDDDKFKDFINGRGLEYEYYWWNETPFNEPDMLLKNMNSNSGFIGVKGHVYLFKYFKDPKISLIDPLDISYKEKDIYDLMKEMRRDEGFFGLIKKPKLYIKG